MNKHEYSFSIKISNITGAVFTCGTEQEDPNFPHDLCQSTNWDNLFTKIVGSGAKTEIRNRPHSQALSRVYSTFDSLSYTIDRRYDRWKKKN